MNSGEVGSKRKVVDGSAMRKLDNGSRERSRPVIVRIVNLEMQFDQRQYN